MTLFEITYLSLQPALPPLYSQVRSLLLASVHGVASPTILDIGGRKSHYTSGVRGDVVITDLPRRSTLQNELHLGLTPTLAWQTRDRRSNVRHIIFDDMTQSCLRGDSFDCAVSVEVLEHVEDDAAFVREVYRVLKPGGAFVMTTPNGDFMENSNPDHKRHYTRAQLHALLASVFANVTVEYAILQSTFSSWGLRSWDIRKPVQTGRSIIGNVVNHFESRQSALRDQATGTGHLIAACRKQVSCGA